jgi:hypothetical protein
MAPVSALAKLRALLAREAPEQAGVVREALRRTGQTGREHSVIGLTNEGGASSITRGTESSVTPNEYDLRQAVRAPGAPSILDFHTHPGAGFSIFETAPSRQDFSFYSTNYPPAKTGRDIRTLIAVPPTRDGMRRATSYNFFSTDNPQRVFDPKMLDAARFELQRAGSKGAFKSIQDDRGDLGELLEDVSPLTLLRYRSGQGLGRHELQLGNKQITPSPESTDTELFRRLEGPAVEVLRSKKFQKGGAVRGALNTVKECSCG